MKKNRPPVILSEAKDPGNSLWFNDLQTTAGILRSAQDDTYRIPSHLAPETGFVIQRDSLLDIRQRMRQIANGGVKVAIHLVVAVVSIDVRRQGRHALFNLDGLASRLRDAGISF